MRSTRVPLYSDDRQPTSDPPAYAARRGYKPGEAVPLVLDGSEVAGVPFAGLLPER